MARQTKIGIQLLFLIAACWLMVGFKPGELPPGTYATTLSKENFPPMIPPHLIPVLSGRWEIVFSAAGGYVISIRGNVVVEGSYIAKPDQLVLTDEKGSLACAEPGQESGIYQWTLDGKRMTLKRIQDKCVGRSLIFTTHPLLRQE